MRIDGPCGNGRDGDRSKGQSAVEFALSFVALLVVVLAIIELGRLLQAWLTVQNSAQAGARFAVTGQCFEDPTVDPWDSARLACIKTEAEQVAGSLNVITGAGASDPGFFEVRVHASDPPEPTPGREYPGGPNTRVAVDVTYNHELITPILREFAPWLRLTGHAEMITERYRHPGYGTPAGELPPTIPPTPTPTPTFTPSPPT